MGAAFIGECFAWKAVQSAVGDWKYTYIIGC